MNKHRWYAWQARPSKIETFVSYVTTYLPEVVDLVCPVVVSEKKTQRGKKIRKVDALYAGYIFLKYIHDEANPSTWLKIKRNTNVVGYIGPCPASEVDRLRR